jgi:hypothetical protein
LTDLGGENKMFAHLEWKELGGGGRRVIADNLTEEEAAAELVMLTPLPPLLLEIRDMSDLCGMI